jgi:hypothetical protein
VYVCVCVCVCVRLPYYDTLLSYCGHDCWTSSTSFIHSFKQSTELNWTELNDYCVWFVVEWVVVSISEWYCVLIVYECVWVVVEESCATALTLSASLGSALSWTLSTLFVAQQHQQVLVWDVLVLCGSESKWWCSLSANHNLQTLLLTHALEPPQSLHFTSRLNSECECECEWVDGRL